MNTDNEPRHAGMFVQPQEDRLFTPARVKYFTIYHLMLSGAIANLAVAFAVCTGHFPAMNVKTNVNLVASNAEALENDPTPTPAPKTTPAAVIAPVKVSQSASELQRMVRDNSGELPVVAPANPYEEYSEQWYRYNAVWHDKAQSKMKG